MKASVLAVLAFVLCTLFFVQSGYAYRLTDNIYFAMTNDTIRCIDLILPDDSGFMGKGEYEYMITCTSNWSDLTEQIVRTDENNTVKIPICFSGFGRKNGECSPPFTIGIASLTLGIEKEWNGGVCISRYPDFDIADEEAEDEDDVREIISGNVDLFDMGFSVERFYSEPGRTIVYSLLIESYAYLTIDLNVKNTGISATPMSETVQTSPADPYHTIYFTVQVPNNRGEYELEVEGRIRDCEGSFCAKKARGTIVVNETLPENGFSTYLFPKSINVKSLKPVLYTLTIQNHGKAKIFSTRIDISPVTETDFEWRDDVIVFENSTQSINFTVTPEQVSTLYEIEVTVSYQGLEKEATASLSTNEMLTNAVSWAEYLKGLNSSLSNDVDSALDDWYNTYKSSNYGEDLDSYATLKDTFAGLGNQTSYSSPETNGDYTPPGEETEGGETEWLWTVIPIVVIVIVVVAIIYMFFRKSEKTGEEGEGEYF